MADQIKYTDAELAKKDIAQMADLRAEAKTQEDQNRYANYEHRAYTRGVVTENPVAAVPMVAAIPVYAASKALGMQQSRSNTSLEQMKQAAIGVGEGLMANSEIVQGAKAFFGTDFKAVAEEVKSKASQTASKAAEFFGMDFGTKKQQEASVDPSTQTTGVVPKYSVDSIFPRLLQAESKGIHMDEKGTLTTSAAGAQGISQLMPKTAKNPGFGIEGVKDQSEAEYKRVGKEYLIALNKKFEGDWEKTLAAYNTGMGNVQKAVGKAERFGGDWKKALPEETKKYMKKILGEGNA